MHLNLQVCFTTSFFIQQKTQTIFLYLLCSSRQFLLTWQKHISGTDSEFEREVVREATPGLPQFKQKQKKELFHS